jgi:hypothetical protein
MGLGIGIGDENIVEIDRLPASGNQDLKGDGCRESYHCSCLQKRFETILSG